MLRCSNSEDFRGGGHTNLSSILNFCGLHQSGFTLAEVLITLGIIGVVAAMTLPTLITKYQKHVTAVGLEKSYSTFTNMIRKAEAAHGAVSEWPEWSSDLPWYRKAANTETVLKNYLAPQLNGAKVYSSNASGGNFYVRFLCDDEDNGGENDGQYKQMGGGNVLTHNNEVIQSMRLADGACVGFKPVDTDNNIAFVFIDINGAKKPNVVGKDLFGFILTYDGKLLPRGHELSDDDLENNNNCPLSGYYVVDCSAAKIMRAGWKVPSYYIWK